MGIIYCDLDSLLTKDSSGRVKNVYNADSVKQSIFTILGTRKGERVMRPNFGSNLHFLLFEPIDMETANDIRYEMFSAITQFEDRININEIKIAPLSDKNQYVVSIDYTVNNIANSQNVTFGLDQNVYV